MSGAVFWIVVWGLTSLAASAIAGVLASMKNRDYSSWMGWSFIFPPLVLFLAILPTNSGSRPKRPSLDDEDKHLY